MFYLYLSLSIMGGIEEIKEAIAEEWLLVMNSICNYALADHAYIIYVITSLLLLFSLRVISTLLEKAQTQCIYEKRAMNAFIIYVIMHSFVAQYSKTSAHGKKGQSRRNVVACPHRAREKVLNRRHSEYLSL